MFWKLTLAEINTVLSGVALRVEREHNDRAWHAWHVAFMTAYAPPKPSAFFKLKTLFRGAKPPERKQQDWRQSLASFSSWVKSTGK